MKLTKVSIILLFFVCQLNLVLAQHWPLVDFKVIEDNVTLLNGFAGGLNAPQFHHIDMNRDGVMDLYVYDRDGFKSMIYQGFQNGDCIQYKFSEVLSSYFPYLTEFVIPKDYNDDQIPDLFSYSQIGPAGIQLYKGVDKGDHLEFEIVVLDQQYANVLAQEFGSNITNVGVSRIDVPAIVDIDMDGDLDILSFPSSGGRISLYHNLQSDRNLPDNAIIFKLVDDCWGGFYESDNSESIFLSDTFLQCASSIGGGAETRHNGSTTLIWDPNRDGLPDALIGDFTSNNIVHVQNGGTIEDAWMTEQDFKFPAYNVSVDMPTFVGAYNLDVNCDNKKDLLIAPNITNGSLKENNVLYYKNTGVFQDSFELISQSFLSETMLDFGMKSAPALVDLNADGWLDLVVGVRVDLINDVPPTGLISLLHNGDSEDPGFLVDNTDYLGLSDYADGSGAFAPTFADMDSDGDMDIIVGDEEGFLFYGENIAGPGQAVNIPTLYYGWMSIDPGQFSAPSVADINNDGLLDLIIGEQRTNNDVNTNSRCGNLNYYQNVGTATAPHFMANSEVSPNTNCLGYVDTKFPGSGDGLAAPAFYDTGDSLIMMTGSYAGFLVRHSVGAVGDVFQMSDSIVGQLDEGFFSMPALGDIDQDGVLEVVIGNQRGGISIYKSDIRTDGSVVSANHDVELADWKVYPNPVTSGDALTLEGIEGLIDASLLGINGRTWKQWQTSNNKTLTLPDVPSGIYYLVVSSNSKSRRHKIVVLNE